MAGAHQRHGTDGARDHRRPRRWADLHDEYVHGLTDQLRTPLGNVLGYTEALLSGDLGPLDARQADVLRLVDRHSQLLLRLLDHVEHPAAVDPDSASHPGDADVGDSGPSGAAAAQELLPVDIAPIVRSAVLSVSLDADRADVALIGRVPDGIMIFADPMQLERAVVKLLANAIEFSYPGGRIGIDVRSTDADATILVVDEGIGIGRDDLGRIFDHGFRSDLARSSDPTGSGLGLSITKSIIDRHGGTIHVESAPGAGTGVTLSIPLARSASTGSDNSRPVPRYRAFVRSARRADRQSRPASD